MYVTLRNEDNFLITTYKSIKLSNVKEFWLSSKKSSIQEYYIKILPISYKIT